MMKIYNTLTRKIDEFQPLGASVGIYTCGPTVYDRAHIGNLSSYIYADLLRRVVNLAGYQTKHVMNITDVDDKTIKRSAETYPDLDPKQALMKLTTDLSEAFFADMKAVGNDTTTVEFVRATDNIEPIQQHIVGLIDDGYAYTADDGVYFDVVRYAQDHKYGQLTQIDPPSSARARIDNDEYDKESAQDFALWKRQKDGEPAWEFVIASNAKQSSDDLAGSPRFARDDANLPGRPGWHIECSVMSTLNLGQPFDIHTGGIDLIFPHHENEIAQCEGELARYFVHNEHLMIDGAKMAKSKNNFYTLEDIAAHGHNPLEFRLLVLQSHFGSATNFSWENLAAAHNRLQAWRNLAELRWQVPDTEDRAQQQIVINLVEQAQNALLDNLNTPEALKYIDQTIDHLAKNAPNISHQALNTLMTFVDTLLGLDLAESTPDISQELKDLISVRQVHRAGGDYAKADEVRDSLLSNGIIINDSSSGTIWARE
jgi:cysteinyl-tRNA synthetase